MKLKIEVDIDYLSEDGSIDDHVKAQIANSIANKLSEESINNLSAQAERLINERAVTLVDSVFSDIMGEKIAITDNWGKVVKEYPDTRAMIKARFDNFMTERVDNEGRQTSYGDQSRLDLIIKKQLDKVATDFTKNAIKEVTEKIKSVLSDDLKLALGDRLINMMELDKIINTKQLKS